MDSESVIVRREPPIGWLIFNRPEKHNAFNLEVWTAIPRLLAELEDDPEIRVIVVRGAGEKAFSAGADISEFKAEAQSGKSPHKNAGKREPAFVALADCQKPTVAMIHGICFGGGSALALNVDLRIVSTEARFAITPARLGLGYPYSGIERAVRELGASWTKYMFLTAGPVDAERALQIGLAHEVHPPEKLEDATRELALKIAANAPLTLQALKECIRQAQTDDENRDIAKAHALVSACFESADYQEGLNAFAEKRKPEFKGK